MLQVYSIYDLKSKVHTSPFTDLTNGAAIRRFTQDAKNPDSMIGRFPADYQLCHLGQYDDATAEIITAPITILGSADQFLE